MVVLTSFTQPTDGIVHRQNNTTVYVNDNNLGKGTLFIAESRLSWVSDSGNGFSIEYPHISLHAVSRDLSAFPQECLFLMLDTALGDEEAHNGDGDNDDGNENGSDDETTEIKLVPDDRGMLEAMFHAMNVCQALHPDPEDSFSDEDFFEDADEDSPLEEAENQMAGLRIESMDGRHSNREEEDMEEDRVVGRVVGRVADRVGGRLAAVDMGADMAGDALGYGGRVADNRVVAEVDREVVEADRVVDRVVDMAEDMAEDTWGTSGVWGRVGDRAEDRVGGMVEDTSGVWGRVGGRVGGMVQHDRSFLSGNSRHRGNPAYSHPARPLQMEGHFDDAEN